MNLFTARLTGKMLSTEIVESPKFQETKRVLSERKYKDTEEGRKMTTFERISSTLRMKGYKYALENSTFQSFLKFRDSEDFQKMMSIKERLKSSELRMYNMI